MRIAFIHPDLGIGGAERLVIDAAVGLQERSHEVAIYTSHCDKTHCFEEARTILDVQVIGDWLPTKFLGKFYILFAMLRQVVLVLTLIFTGKISQYDVFIIDQLSFCVPLVHLFKHPKAKVLFYCHFPDQLLASHKSLIREIYRYPIDRVEEFTTGSADKIVVNSNFTKSIFHKTFTHLESVEPGVIYPCVNKEIELNKESLKEVDEFFVSNKFFLSINRFERKKNIELAIEAFAKFRLTESSSNKCKPRLVIAGGFDSRVKENVLYLQELEKLTQSLNLKSIILRGKLIILPPMADIIFLPSISSDLKDALIKKTQLLLYTPSFEHFGIVPIEAMRLGTPVLAINNGGPKESIINKSITNKTDIENATGYLSESDDKKWAGIMTSHWNLNDDDREILSSNGIKRVHSLFTREAMTDAFIDNLAQAEVLKFNFDMVLPMLRFVIILSLAWGINSLFFKKS